MTNPLPKLLPCFYCDNEELKIDMSYNSPSNAWVLCHKCGYRSGDRFKSMSEAREAHNHIYRCIDEAFMRIIDRKR